MQRAAIYIRVSSERQAEGVSPEAQETDCLAWCGSKNYQVTDVYRDIEKYRIGKKMVEPSGTRADRPGLKRMLADAYADKLDVIVAWREDRLYRSYRPMLDVLDCIDETRIDIELVKETFDKRIAPVKAWAARMELDAKHDRFMMGVAGRLERGKSWNGGTPYGYMKENDHYVINEVEAEWVRKIYTWFADGESGKSIRTSLINGNAPQKEGIKIPWPLQRIFHILKRDYYTTGILTRRWGDTTYETHIPTIIDAETQWRVKERFARWKKYPAGNMKEHALAAGLVYCAACNRKMVVKRYPESVCYVCTNLDQVCQRLPGCAATRSIRLLDRELWGKVWSLIAEPGKFEELLEERLRQLQAGEIDAGAEVEKLERELGDLAMERQKVITWARKSFITEEDLNTQYWRCRCRKAN